MPSPTPMRTRVTEISWDAARGVFHGMVAVSHPTGVSMTRVSAPGRPGWGHARVCAALVAACPAPGALVPQAARHP